MIGEGKYNELCTEIRKRTEAEGVILIVLRGNLGNGFSAQLSLEDTLSMPVMLRSMADAIEEDFSRGKL